MQSQRCLKAPSCALAPVVRPQPRRPRCLVAQAAASAVATPENAGDETWNKTYYPKLADTRKVEKEWYIIDAAGQKLGRLATLAATYVRGKHSPTYSPSMDMGAMLVVINAEQVIMSGDKMEQKTYMRHVNGKPGSYTIESFKNLQARIPERIVEKAVYGMLPKGRLGRRIRLNMKVYKGSAHPHEAQQPIDITDKISVSSHKN